MKKNAFAVLMLLSTLIAMAQQRQEVVDYINQYKQIAIDEMVRAKIPASITLAQGILESGAGKSPLSRNSNNHFGIKCKEEWTGKKYYHDDDRPQECFRVYDSPQQSYFDHSEFLVNRPRYSMLFQLPVHDYKSWAYGLKEAGYATNPKYPQLLINYIEDYNLHQYDREGLVLMEQKKTELPERSQALETKPDASRADDIIVMDVKPAEQHKMHQEQPRFFATEIMNHPNQRKELVVNGIRAVKAKGAEDPFTIAYEYNIDYSYIMSFNDLNTGDRFKDGEHIFLQPKKNRGADAVFVVQQGQSMRDIAQIQGIRIKDLYAKNLMRPNDQPVPGETLYLQNKRSSTPRTVSYAEFLKKYPQQAITETVAQEQPVSNTHNPELASNTARSTDVSQYQVRQTDTLYSIARRFGISVEQLKKWNNLSDSSIKIGQTLVISE